VRVLIFGLRNIIIVTLGAAFFTLFLGFFMSAFAQTDNLGAVLGKAQKSLKDTGKNNYELNINSRFLNFNYPQCY
jgi:hypothetical protein